MMTEFITEKELAKWEHDLAIAKDSWSLFAEPTARLIVALREARAKIAELQTELERQVIKVA